ncbi:hypothetical protein FJZ19_02405 [Candidatus Pacearchaeota archaeon]|nr:hypothetical protein [Candidatus Pacearchaeota archaeon]
MEKKIGLLFDCLRAPYDAAHIIQVALAVRNCDLYISGNSVDMQNRKITSKVRSWKINSLPYIERFETFDFAVRELHERGRYLIGTSPHFQKSVFELDLSEGKSIFVFGSESGGLSREKISKLDEIVSIPISKEVPFLTLPVAVSIIAYEYYRQLEAKR